MLRQNKRLERIADALETWFAEVQRPLPWRRRYDPYEVWVSEVMLQQTRMEVVLPRFSSFVARFPTVAALASASEEEVVAQWSGLGYYRRARMLHAGAIAVVRDYAGVIPSEPALLRSIPGVGRYTAGAIASIAFEQREPLVDGNVARVGSRIEAITDSLGTSSSQRKLWAFAEALVEECGSPRALNQGLMELGATICTPSTPACDVCPVGSMCKARKLDRVADFPLPKSRKTAIAMSIPLFIWTDQRRRVLMVRPEGTLMRGMTHLPHGSGELIAELEVAAPARSTLLGSVRHTVTHRRVEFQVFLATSNDVCALRESAAAEWVDPSELHRYPHPSYVAKALRLAKLI